MRSPFLICAISALLCCSCESKESPVEDPAVNDSVPNLVVQVQKCSKLYTTEYHIHKIVTHHDVLRLKGSLLTIGRAQDCYPHGCYIEGLHRLL